MVNYSELYREQASYCAFLLSRPMNQARRSLIEREREDWLMLADRQNHWVELQAERRPSNQACARPADCR